MCLHKVKRTITWSLHFTIGNQIKTYNPMFDAGNRSTLSVQAFSNGVEERFQVRLLPDSGQAG